MPFPERNTEQDRFAYLYNGKELDEMTGLYYYGARYYDPRDGIFLGVDPLAEKYANISPYAYCFNNPIRYIDPTGMEGDEPPTHTVQKDETLWRISRYYNIYPNELRELNGMAPRETLIKPGQKLIVRDNWQKPPIETAKADKTSFQGSKNFYMVIPKDASIENQAETGNRVHVISAANGMAAVGPFGAMFDFGGIVDDSDSKVYMTIGWAYGFGASAGMGYSVTSKNTSCDNMAGRSNGASLSLYPSPFGIEGYGDLGGTEGLGGNVYRGIGGNIGVGKGWFGYVSWTVTFTPPPPTYWLGHGTMR